MRLSGMGRALELLLILIRVVYEWTFSPSLSRLSVVYARKHSSRHKVERLVYYFRYMLMWSNSEIFNCRVVCLDKGRMSENERERDKIRSRVIDIIKYVVFLIYLFILNSYVYTDRLSLILTHLFCSRLNGSVVCMFVYMYLKWTDDETDHFTYTQLSRVHKQITSLTDASRQRNNINFLLYVCIHLSIWNTGIEKALSWP